MTAGRLRAIMPRLWPGLILAGLLAVLIAGAAVGLLLDRLFPLPLARFHDRSPLVVAEDGAWLRAFPSGDGSWRLMTRADQVPPLFLDMLVAAEDRRFFLHPGIDPLALVRAGLQWLARGRVVSGGSTLTMQVAKLLDPQPRTLSAKLVEIFRALQLGLRHDRDDVLAMWLTLAPFGGNLEGVRVASLAWFGREPAELAPAEMALLVALPRAPEQLRPDRHPERARIARDRLIRRLAARGAIDADTAAAATAMPVPTKRRRLPMLAPHLAEQLLARRPAAAADPLVTTLDRPLQEGVERLLRARAATLAAPVNVAVVVIEHATGKVRAWAGSAAYADHARHGMVDHARAIRSPGSTLKPFVYGLAFDRFQAHPRSIVRDEPRRFADYAPDNFDDGFSGETTVTAALQRSLNLPAVTVLDRLGPVGFVQGLADAGLDLQLDPRRPAGLPVILGGVGTSLVQLVAAYGAIAGDGQVRQPRMMPGQTVPSDRPLLTPAAAAALRSILAQVPRPIGARPDRVLAYKTGTSFRFKDGWAIGFDGRHAAGVWVGRSDAAPCARACSGLGGAAPILAAIFDLVEPAPLPPAPADSPFLGDPPAALARLDQLAGQPDAGPPLRLEFPADASVLEAGRADAVPLRAAGGRLPYRWYVEGAPLAAGATRRRETVWRSPGPGWNEIMVVDADGRAARARVRLLAGNGSGEPAGMIPAMLPGLPEHGVPEGIARQEAFDGVILGGGQDEEGEPR
ncbi:MAG TPA: penicillin-binding protein 1C [Geminicoccus sp.]|uniref:penicillin-binding protein 1C n=1 Tax=Geminicoccus sp. TaxID=2024832 RepID=UPI002E32BF50|nr:penicillin-binding protein 1C [Geminicoccus sp.]HEX2528954.1 penicillin-binding protein 1C [Geminicoccus sp.]